MFLLLNRQMSILFCFIKLIESNHSFNKQQDESNKLLLGVIDSLSPPELLSQLLPSSNGNKYDENTIKSNINSEFEYQTNKSRSPLNSDFKRVDPSRFDPSRSTQKKKQECINHNISLYV